MVKLGEILPPLYHVINELGNDIAPLDLTNWQEEVDGNMRQRQNESDSFLNGYFHLLYDMFCQIPWDIQISEPLIPWGTIITVLLILNRRVSIDIFVLVFCFLSSMNPLYVCLAYISYRLYINRYSSPKCHAIKSPVFSDYAIYKPEEFNKTAMLNTAEDLDVILVGNDVATLFAGALLSKVGYRCCILQPRSISLASIGIPHHFEDSVPLRSATMGRPSRYVVRGLLLLDQQHIH